MNIIKSADRGINWCPDPPPLQTHVHELAGSVELGECYNQRHDHRYATVTSEVIPSGLSHRHTFCVKTSYQGHYHEISGETGKAIEVGSGKHVHYAEGQTTMSGGHCHNYQFATLID